MQTPKNNKKLSFIYTVLLMALSTVIAFFLFHLVPNNSANIALIYIVALIILTKYTDGYLYGIIFSLFTVICVNFFFTFPFFKLNFTLTGYPITFIIMLIITLTTSKQFWLRRKKRKCVQTFFVPFHTICAHH